MVAAGAPLRATDTVELPALTVDCSAAGMGTIDGFTVAANGRINLVNLDKGNKNLVVPLTISNCAGLENFADWEVYVNGASVPTGSWGAKVEADKVTVFAKGLSVIVR